MDYMGNKREYYQSLFSAFEKELKVKLTPLINKNTEKLIGEWSMKGHNFNSEDILLIDKQQNISIL